MSEIKRLSERVKLIEGENLGRYPFSHSLLIEDEITALIDPASNFACLQGLAQSGKVNVIILSHYHEDHFWYSYLFPRAEIWMPETDAPALDTLDCLLDAYGLTGPWREDWRKLMLDKFHYEQRPKSRLFKDGDKISLGKTEFEVLHTPGHTQGHSCFLFPDQSVMFLADIDLTRFGPWYGDVGSDIDDFIRSIRRVAGVECGSFVVSHEQPLYRGNIRKEAEAYLRVIEERDEKLRQILARPCTAEDVINARIIYRKPREPKSFFDFGEWALMSKHVARMLKRGEAIQTGDKYRLR